MTSEMLLARLEREDAVDEEYEGRLRVALVEVEGCFEFEKEGLLLPGSMVAYDGGVEVSLWLIESFRECSSRCLRVSLSSLWSASMLAVLVLV